MEAACRGAKEGGGLTIGILPGQDAAEANRYVDVPIVTGMGYARNIIIVRTAQAIVALDGSFGTLSELAHALQMAKPLVAVGCRIAPPEAPQVEDPEEAVARLHHNNHGQYLQIIRQALISSFNDENLGKSAFK